MAESGKNAEIGVGHPHYAGPEHGPFRCDHCIHFRKPTFCNHPDIVELKELPKLNGRTVVHPKGCCNYFRDKA